MILQSILYQFSDGNQSKLYYKSESELSQTGECLVIPPICNVSFFSYINIFDIDAWKKYTSLSTVRFMVDLYGTGSIFLKNKTTRAEFVLTEYHFSNQKNMQWENFTFDINIDELTGCCYFEINSDSEVQIKNGRFEIANVVDVYHKVKLSLNICTYHRNKDILRNLRQLKKSRFFKPDDELYSMLCVMVVDNASELELIDEPYIRLVHNPNTGGSGGFKRGLDEIRQWNHDITHVIFMDDDVEFLSESLYRLYALLSYIRVEYYGESIAGRMFRTDNRHIQYTAVEIWNRGNLKHIGLNADMTKESEILCSNQNNNAEYGGWWFCCYPMTFATNNDPMPFFIHCDDVEYGLRHGGTPIILNGIQVWHETYEYRKTPIIAYYDTRNTLILNTILYSDNSSEDILDWWKNKITEQHIQKDFSTEYMIILGMLDYLKGKRYFETHNAQKRNKKLKNIKNIKKVKNSFLRRFTECVFRFRYKKAAKTFDLYKNT